jgi:hypothetical protein
MTLHVIASPEGFRDAAICLFRDSETERLLRRPDPEGVRDGTPRNDSKENELFIYILMIS